MPAKGTSYHRNNIISKELYKKFLDEFKMEIDYETFVDIILESNSIIFDIIANEPTGFKIPENMGYWVVTKYKTKKKPIDWKNSRRLKKQVYLTNLHSFGYVYHIKWCKFAIARFKFNEIYKFSSCRFLARKVAQNGKNGFTYFNWKNSDFWNTFKLDRTYYKKYKNKQD